MGSIDGSIPIPEVNDPLYPVRRRCNTLIISWILRSVTQWIATNVFFINTTIEVWETLRLRYSQPEKSKINCLQQMLLSISHGNRTADEYYTELNGDWEELKNFSPLPHCQCGRCEALCFQKFADDQMEDYVYRFLHGLNDEYNALKTQILSVKPFPSIDETYNMVIKRSHIGI